MPPADASNTLGSGPKSQPTVPAYPLSRRLDTRKQSFLNLPRELRDLIYQPIALDLQHHSDLNSSTPTVLVALHKCQLRLGEVSKQTYHEFIPFAIPYFTFVQRLDTLHERLINPRHHASSRRGPTTKPMVLFPKIYLPHLTKCEITIEERMVTPKAFPMAMTKLSKILRSSTHLERLTLQLNGHWTHSYSCQPWEIFLETHFKTISTSLEALPKLKWMRLEVSGRTDGTNGGTDRLLVEFERGMMGWRFERLGWYQRRFFRSVWRLHWKTIERMQENSSKR